MMRLKNMIKSLLTSLCQREEFPLIKGGQGVVGPSLAKRGEGRFYGKCLFNYKAFIKAHSAALNKARYENA
jgi:hypothetical protein